MIRRSATFTCFVLLLLLAAGSPRAQPGFDDLGGTAEEAQLPDPVRAMFVFTRFPRPDGSFEIEASIECRYDIADLRLVVQSTDDVTLSERLEVRGPRRAGELKAWRIRGTFPPAADPPAAVSLLVDFTYPKAAIEREVRARWSSEAEVPVRDRLLAQLAAHRLRRETVVRALELVPRKEAP